MPELVNMVASSTNLYESTIGDALEKRMLIFNEDFSEDLVENYIYHIIKWNMEDKDIVPEQRKPITILLNSPGGDSIIGFGLVNVIENSQTPVHVIGIGLVASMAFYLFIACHKRYAFPSTILLLHDGETCVQNSAKKAKETQRFLDEMEDRTKTHVLKYTSFSSDKYDEIYGSEYYMYADAGGKQMNCVDGIIGTDVSLLDIL